MPSRGNPNVPTSVKNRARSRKAGVKARTRPVAVRSDPGQPITKSDSGVHHKRTLSNKRVRKDERKVLFAKLRKEAEEEKVRKEGEGGVVEMTDIATLPVSRRQQKLAMRAAAVAEANAKAAAEKGAGVEVPETVGDHVEADAGMDID